MRVTTLEHVEGLTYWWQDEVRLVIVDEEEYVRTDGDEKARDELGESASVPERLPGAW